jgi:hypothetical protein
MSWRRGSSATEGCRRTCAIQAASPIAPVWQRSSNPASRSACIQPQEALCVLAFAVVPEPTASQIAPLVRGQWRIRGGSSLPQVRSLRASVQSRAVCFLPGSGVLGSRGTCRLRRLPRPSGHRAPRRQRRVSAMRWSQRPGRATWNGQDQARRCRMFDSGDRASSARSDRSAACRWCGLSPTHDRRREARAWRGGRGFGRMKRSGRTAGRRPRLTFERRSGTACWVNENLIEAPRVHRRTKLAENCLLWNAHQRSERRSPIPMSRSAGHCRLRHRPITIDVPLNMILTGHRRDAKSDAALSLKIGDAWEDNRKLSGARKICRALRREGKVVGR